MQVPDESLVMVQLTPEGSTSVKVTSLATPSPVLVTRIVKTALSPAEIEPLPSFSTVTSGQSTVTVASSELLVLAVSDSFAAATNAVLSRSPQSSASVVPFTVTVRVAPGAKSPKLQVSSFPLATAHPALLVVQVTPAGRVSVTETSLAIPEPVLVTTIVNEAISPALMVPFPTLEITMSGQLTVTDAEDDAVPSLEVPASAVLDTTPHVSGVVPEEM